ncbi:MAG: hypothetical protein AAGA54_31625 [Myxococcota bacterium]
MPIRTNVLATALVATFSLPACDDPAADAEANDATDASQGGKADNGSALTKASRCDWVCSANDAYETTRSFYCEDTFPSWLGRFVSDAAGTSPPIPEFSAYSVAGDGKLNPNGSWTSYQESAVRRDNGFDAIRDAPDTNPNKWGTHGSLSDDFLWTSDHQPGTWAAWPLSIPPSDEGQEWSLYAYVPPGATNRNVAYRVYDGNQSSAALTHTIDQTDYSGAEITLFGLSYNAPGWHFLGRTRLYSGASVSVDGSTGSGTTFADTVVALRWGCVQ